MADTECSQHIKAVIVLPLCSHEERQHKHVAEDCEKAKDGVCHEWMLRLSRREEMGLLRCSQVAVAVTV